MRDSQVFLGGLTVQNSIAQGVEALNSSDVHIFGSTIQGHSSEGLRVRGNATVRIFGNDITGADGATSITNNFIGINILEGGSVFVSPGTALSKVSIDNNTLNGISVGRSSFVDLSDFTPGDPSNTISVSNNGNFGLFVRGHSEAVVLNARITTVRLKVE